MDETIKIAAILLIVASGAGVLRELWRLRIKKRLSTSQQGYLFIYLAMMLPAAVFASSTARAEATVMLVSVAVATPLLLFGAHRVWIGRHEDESRGVS